MGKAKRNREKREAESADTEPGGQEDTASQPLSFELKQMRARDHLQDMNQVVQRWAQVCLETLREEPDPEEAGYFCAWIDPAPIDSDLLSVQLGDCLQCLRSSLDHLAFELATTFTSPLTDEIEKRSEFPIFGDERGDGSTRFHACRSKGARAGEPIPSSGVAKIAGIDPAAQTVIEGLQPYHRGKEFDSDPLWVIHELNRLDKHRLLHVVTWAMEGATFPVAGPNLPKSEWPRNVAAIGRSDGQPSVLQIAGGEVSGEGRALVARWPMIPIDPSKEMHMGFKPVLGVVFDPATPLVGGRPVLDTLMQLHDYVITDVFAPLRPFL